ncbi:MAG: lipid-A-disaccharide synthase [Desulfobacterales bacterium]|nr:lipid-A-disaccharide synthase [Desulfobacterales bacterium]
MMPRVASVPSERSRRPAIMIVAGEASGDLHGAKLAAALTAVDSRLTLFGIGGDHMRAAGVRVTVDARQLAVVGLTEVFTKLPGILRGWRVACRMLAEGRPDLLILIDFPDFNLRLARRAKQLQTKVLYYISPQIWAWRRRRVRQIRRRVDHMAVILPFEAEFYRRHGVNVSFVGHPLMDHDPPSGQAPRRSTPDMPPVLGLLPGSRDSEISRLLPAMLDAALRLQQRLKVRVMLSCADSVDTHRVARLVAPYRDRLHMDTIGGGPQHIFQSADVVIAASGTVTLEAALWGVPMLIVYRVSPLSYLLGKALIRVPHIGLVNLIAGRRVVPELIQQTATPTRIAAEAESLLMQPARRDQMRAGLAEVKQRLGAAGASTRVARIATQMLGRTAGPSKRSPDGAPPQCH